MPDKAVSKILLPDSLLSAWRPWLAKSWDLAVAGTVVLVWLGCAGVFIGNLADSVKAGLATEFDYMPELAIFVVIAVIVVSSIVRSQRSSGSSSALMASSLVLLAALGAFGAGLGVVGFFVSFGLGTSELFYAVENIAGLVLGLTFLVWAVGELGKLSRQPATPAVAGPSTGAAALLGQVESLDLRGLVPPSVSGRKETATSWEIAAFGWVLATVIFVVDAIGQNGIGVDFRGATLPFLVIAPLALFAISVAVRTTARSTTALGAACLDLAMVLVGALAALLAVISVINFFGAFTDHGFGNVVEGLLLALGRVVFAAVVIGWALGELATMRLAGTGEVSVHPAADAAAPSVVPEPVTAAEPALAPVEGSSES